MEKIKNVLLQLSSNGNRMTGEIERQRLHSENNEQLQLFSTLRPVYSDATQLNVELSSVGEVSIATRRRNSTQLDIELSCVAINGP